jgi:putative ABC transport system permease protein
MTKRLGADLLVVPEGSSARAEAILLQGEPDFFYFSGALVKTIASIDGVIQASPQFFLSSIAGECCDAPVQLIAFDPDTDFAIQPWIGEVLGGPIRDGSIVIGSNVLYRKDNLIRFFDHEYPVAARLAKTATSMDKSVFMNMNTMGQMLENARRQGFHFIADGMPEGSISAVLVRLEGGSNQRAIAASIKDKNQGVEVIHSQGIFEGIAETLNSIIRYIRLFSSVIWIAALIILGVVFSASINERKKEFAVLRILGATRKRLVIIILREAALAGLAGSAGGIILASLVIFPFSTYISLQLQLPLLRPQGLTILGFLFFSFFISFAAGPLASAYSAVKISAAETYYTLREGE